MSKRKKIFLLINIFWFISCGVMAGGKEELMVASAASDPMQVENVTTEPSALRGDQQPQRRQEALPAINGSHPQNHVAQEFLAIRRINTVEDLQKYLERLSNENTKDIDNLLAVASAYRHMGTREGYIYALKIHYAINSSNSPRISDFQRSMSFLGGAKITSRIGRLDDVCNLVWQAVAKDPSNPYTLIWYSEHAIKHGCLIREDMVGYLSGGLHLAQDARTQAKAHICLGNVRDGRDRGVAHYNEALRLLGEYGDVNLRAQALIGLGNARTSGEQAAYYQAALGVLDRDGDVNLRAQTLIGLGNVCRANRQNAEAIRYYDEVLGLRDLSYELRMSAEKGRHIAQRFIALDERRHIDRTNDRFHPDRSMRSVRQYGDSNHRSATSSMQGDQQLGSTNSGYGAKRNSERRHRQTYRLMASPY